MARYIDADELLGKLSELQEKEQGGIRGIQHEGGWIAVGIGYAIDVLRHMLKAQKEVVAVLPQDYHDRCMELEISRRFAAEQKVKEYPYALDAIRNDLTNAIGLVERLQGLSLAQKTSDKSDE